VVADAKLLKRAAVGASETVTSAGAIPTRSEVAAWANAKYQLDNDTVTTLRPAPLTRTVPTVDWVDEYGVRHVRLRQYHFYSGSTFL